MRPDTSLVIPSLPDKLQPIATITLRSLWPTTEDGRSARMSRRARYHGKIVTGEGAGSSGPLHPQRGSHETKWYPRLRLDRDDRAIGERAVGA